VLIKRRKEFPSLTIAAFILLIYGLFPPYNPFTPPLFIFCPLEPGVLQVKSI